MVKNRKNEKIKQSIENLLKLVNAHEPPIPVERIARLRGVQLKYVPFEGDMSGLLFQERGHAIIGVNELHPKTRQRFTIAHELGHLELHSHDELHIDRNYRIHLRNERSSQAIDPAEIDANAFAAELLMPTAMIIRDLKDQTVDFENDELLHSLANRYKVSLQAMILRLTNLRLIDLSASP
jgi:Zn-dependent peptidase ImmA (M78 family)